MTSCTTSRRAPRHVVLFSLLISVLVHALALSIPLGLDLPLDERRRRSRVARPSAGSMRVLNLRTDAEAIRARPSVPTAPTDTSVAPIPVSTEASYGREQVRQPTATELLRPHLFDPRLWSSPPAAPPSPTLPEAMRLGRRAAHFNRDAAGVHVPSGEDMSVWTARDGQDRRWGFSPGAIHLGGLTIPLCSGSFDAASCGFGVQPVFRDAYHMELRTRLEIQRQRRRGDLQDRAKAMRARLDSLRDSVPRVPRR